MSVSLQCADCGTMDDCQDPALSGIQWVKPAERRLCGECTAGLYERIRALDGEIVDDHEQPSSWEPVDLAAILSGEQHDQPPGMLARADGVCLLYAGRIHAMSAEPESCKGWAALHASAERIAAGEHVVYADYEDTAANIVARLLALDVDHGAIRERFNYLRPDDPVTAEAVEAVTRLEPALVIVDGVTEALAMEALDMANNQDVAEFHKRLARPFARAAPRCC